MNLPSKETSEVDFLRGNPLHAYTTEELEQLYPEAFKLIYPSVEYVSGQLKSSGVVCCEQNFDALTDAVLSALPAFEMGMEMDDEEEDPEAIPAMARNRRGHRPYRPNNPCGPRGCPPRYPVRPGNNFLRDLAAILLLRQLF